MLNLLIDPIFPIFAVLIVGFILQRRGGFDVESARAVNRFVFFVATPALLFSIVSRLANVSIDLRLLAVYLGVECVIYASVFWVMFKVLKRDLRESILLGMTACFVNHVFFVLPIAERIYGDSVSGPIASIILVDAFVFCFTTVLMDIAGTKERRNQSTVVQLAKNPFLIACGLGMIFWPIPSLIPNAVMTYTHFIGAAAAPASLFALGVVLASHSIKSIDSGTWVVLLSKIAIHPILFFLAVWALQMPSEAADISLLVAAGPCGAMPFVIALQFGVQSNAITKAIILSTLISLFTLAALTA